MRTASDVLTLTSQTLRQEYQSILFDGLHENFMEDRLKPLYHIFARAKQIEVQR